ncbi:alkaline phosphatase [uncultured Meiothermus sp.]|jgi:alkaline phosphatase|uniref:alkaline phosphatase n=1 Tax=uncultured Meiothermus sp. TaxID=157471 RepID=UPI002606EF72|nr:alkaline phosphatase [uncultured Meiothermus sp.]
MKRLLAIAAAALLGWGLAQQTPQRGNVIFFHPDGAGLNNWGAARIMFAGPDGLLNWDRMSHMAVYRGHMKNSLVGTSNAGAVTHATGVKVHAASFGILEDNTSAVVSRNGQPLLLMQEAVRAGMATALINSGTISEPGTGAFVARAANRADHAGITRQILESGVDVIMGGGEVWYLPRGTRGRFGVEGQREDGLNLIERARALGYTIVYNREELLALPANTRRVLGIFAPEDVFQTLSEEDIRQRNLANYLATAPTIAQKLQKTLEIFSAQPGRRFFIVAEEEGTDNLCNANNANGCLEALKRSDDAIGVAMQFITRNPRTMLLTAADSEAGGMGLLAVAPDRPVPAADRNGAPLDGVGGRETAPFMSAPDAGGRRWPFAIGWGTFSDSSGGILARAHGVNAGLMPSIIDNTDIYRLMYATLFGELLPAGVIVR